MSLRNLRHRTLAAALPVLMARTAQAGDPPSTAQLNAARDLFLAAEKDEDAERWADALEKLERVAAVKLTPGVRYHTALCEEHLGRLVAALDDYKTAAVQARAENARDVLRLVDRRIADATERVPRITIVIVPSIPEATVRLDGGSITPGVPALAEPGAHSIDAEAPGRRRVVTTVTVKERDVTRVDVALEAEAPAPAPPSPPPARPPPAARPDKRESSGNHTLALVAGASAVALAAGGLAAYLTAGKEHDDSVPSCARTVSPLVGACDAQKNAVRAWDWVGVAAWTGAAAAATVAIVSLLRSHPDAGHEQNGRGPPPPGASVVLGPASMALEGTF
jgi:tetratricopeptide (TPR) repeat protein